MEFILAIVFGLIIVLLVFLAAFISFQIWDLIEDYSFKHYKETQTWYNVYRDKKIVYTTPSKKLLREYMQHAKEVDKHKYKIVKEKY